MNNRATNCRAERLVDTAKESFARRGYYATSISELAQQAGIARSTFYQHFDNKLHLFQSILDSFLEDLRKCIRPVVLGPGVSHPLAQIEDNLTRVLNFVLQEAELSQILLTHAGTPRGTVQKGLNEFYRQVAEMIERSLNFGMSMNLVRPCNTRLTAWSVIGAVKEVVLRLTSSQEPQPPVEELVRELLDFGMGGILVKSRLQSMEPSASRGGRNLGGGSSRGHSSDLPLRS